MQVLRGFAGNSASNLSRVARIAQGEQIRSGQPVTLDAEGKVVVADSAVMDADTQVFFSWHDYTDGDAKEAGAQLLDTKGTYEILTAWFDADANYPEGTKLAVGTGAKKGLVIPAGGGDKVIGIAVQAKNGSCVQDMSGQISETQNMNMLRMQLASA